MKSTGVRFFAGEYIFNTKHEIKTTNQTQSGQYLKKIFLLFAVSFFLLTTTGAQEKVKTGYNIGGLPAVSYNSDEGFQYGVILNLFNYGDGTKYPKYDYSTYLEVSRYTKGSSLYRLYFDSENLIKNVRTFFDISYIKEDMLDFYGFNGLKSKYLQDLEAVNRAYYRMSQNQIRLLADFKGRFLVDNLNWLASYNFYKFTPGEVNFDKLNKNVSTDDPDYLDGTSLYGKYVDWGIISDKEADGGIVNVFKAGLIYDSREVMVNPDKGVCSEALIEIAPGFMNELPYMRYSVVHRQYFNLVKEKLNLAVRLGAQGKIGKNNIPFYRRNQMISPFANRANIVGLGGANSLRGIVRNRVIGDGFAYGNFELRWRAIDFQFINQNWYIGFNGFMDTGIITDEVDWNLSLPNPQLLQNFALENEQKLHTSIGGGLKIGMNENFVISVDLGKALDDNDASKMGTYININYLF